MKRERMAGTSLMAASTAMILLSTGCPGPSDGSLAVPPEVTSASVTVAGGALALNQAASVTITATVVDLGATVVAVVADLTELGGPAGVPLAPGTAPGTWSTTQTVTPTQQGTRTVTITATNSAGQTGQGTATINVGGSSGTNAPPQLSNPTIVGTLTANISSTVILSVTATDPDGAVASVAVNLSNVGGLPAQPMTRSAQDPSIWTFTGPLTPTTTGTQIIQFLAVDNLGATATASLVTPVNAVSP